MPPSPSSTGEGGRPSLRRIAAEETARLPERGCGPVIRASETEIKGKPGKGEPNLQGPERRPAQSKRKAGDTRPDRPPAQRMGEPEQ